MNFLNFQPIFHRFSSLFPDFLSLISNNFPIFHFKTENRQLVLPVFVLFSAQNPKTTVQAAANTANCLFRFFSILCPLFTIPYALLKIKRQFLFKPFHFSPHFPPGPVQNFLCFYTIIIRGGNKLWKSLNQTCIYVKISTV